MLGTHRALLVVSDWHPLPSRVRSPSMVGYRLRALPGQPQPSRRRPAERPNRRRRSPAREGQLDSPGMVGSFGGYAERKQCGALRSRPARRSLDAHDWAHDVSFYVRSVRVRDKDPSMSTVMSNFDDAARRRGLVASCRRLRSGLLRIDYEDGTPRTRVVKLNACARIATKLRTCDECPALIVRTTT